MERVLDKIDKPQDLRVIRKELLLQLVKEIREEIISTVSKTGGHLASNLGTVELIVALHYVFDMPKDKIIFDVGHQSYTHKLLTGRREKFHTLRQFKGISGFPNPEESEYDVFATGHSSTAISAAVGFAVARDLKKEDHKVIAVIGDGSITSGLAFEGLNNAGYLKSNILVILNDNEMFISHRVGAIAGYLAKILTLGLVKEAEKRIDKFLRRLHFVGLYILRIAKRFKLLFFPGMLFEEMGFSYVGPVDGHDLFGLIDILTKVKKSTTAPLLLHVVTKKGKGYKPAEKDPTKFHGALKFEIESGEMAVDNSLPTYTDVFSRTLIEIAKTDDKVIAITAAMSEGTGLSEFAKKFPDRFFDVGIAEQHALTFAAGLAANGFRPVVAIYSAFLQRGLDQLIHDIALQKLPVLIAIDRAGIVGEDGSTHQGIFDISYLRLIPNFVIMAPKDENELKDMLYTAFKINQPVAIRFPRRKGIGVKIEPGFELIPFGKSEVLKEGTDVCIIGVGDMVNLCLSAASMISENLDCGVVNVRFIKPLDVELLKEITKKVKSLVVVEENVATGGLYSAVREKITDPEVRVLSIGLPDRFIEHGAQKVLHKKYGLTAENIAEKIREYAKNLCC